MQHLRCAAALEPDPPPNVNCTPPTRHVCLPRAARAATPPRAIAATVLAPSCRRQASTSTSSSSTTDHHDLVARVLSVRCVRAARRRPPRAPAACAAQPCRRAPVRFQLSGASARCTYAAPPVCAQDRRPRQPRAGRHVNRAQRLHRPSRGNRRAPLPPCTHAAA